MVVMEAEPTIEDLVLRAQDGDEVARNEVIVDAQEMVRKTALATTRNMRGVDPDDLAQELSMMVPRYIGLFNPEKSRKWKRYLYYKLRTGAIDILRTNDPLGIGNPQKHKYPNYDFLSDLSLRNEHGGDFLDRRSGSTYDMQDLLEAVAARVELADPEILWWHLVDGLSPAECCRKCDGAVLFVAQVLKAGLREVTEMLCGDWLERETEKLLRGY